LLRLSDETETAIGVASGGENMGASGCLLLCGWEGSEDDVQQRASKTLALLSGPDVQAEYLGPDAAKSWQSARFQAPRQRDELVPAGVLVETVETACRWRDVQTVHDAVAEALRTRLDGYLPIVACHISHTYAAGASLYFSVLARQDSDDPVRQWQRAKAAACDAMAAAGATITHHHSVGSDHAPWMTAEVGEAGVSLLRAIKEHLDPVGVLNPGKLF
jgi:alkyldihydroxyacetonephosphate synthase